MKIWIIRAVGLFFILLGAFFVKRLDHMNPDERYFKIMALFSIPVGIMIILATLIPFLGV